MEKFKAFRLTEVDKKITANFESCDLDALDPGEVVVRVAYSDVNYKDALAATGKGRILQRASCIGGIDFSGTVVSSSDARFTKGDAVLATGYDLGVKHHGGYAEYARVPADWLVKMPAGLTLWEAMALGTAGFTAGMAIVRMEQNGLTPASGKVIVSGATGGVGSIAVDALSRLGYHVVALTGKESETAYLQGLGAKEVMLRQSIDLSKIRPLDKALWAGAVDNLGGDVLAWMLSGMQLCGSVASIGLAASMNLPTTVAPFILRGVRLWGVDSVMCPLDKRNTAWERLATEFPADAQAHMQRTVGLSEVPAQAAAFMAGTSRGRVVVDVNR